MFSRVTDTSKVASILVSRFLEDDGFDLLDRQFYFPHLERMDKPLIPRKEFMARLLRALKSKTKRGS